MHRCIVVMVAMLLAFGALEVPRAYAADTRTFVGETRTAREAGKHLDEVRAQAWHDAMVVALQHGAEDLTAWRFPETTVADWLQSWDDFGIARRGINERVSDGSVWLKVEVRVDVPTFLEVIRSQAERGEWVVAVAVDEVILRLPPPPDPAVETVTRQLLQILGYQVLDETIADRNEMRDRIRALRRGDQGAADWFSERFRADILIYGEAFAEEVRRGGVHAPRRFTAMAELHAVALDTARGLGSTTRTSVVEGESPNQCGKIALWEAGKSAAAHVLRMVEISLSDTPTEIIISGTPRLDVVDTIGQVLVGIVGEEGRVGRERPDLQNATCSWDVTGTVSAREIARGLENTDRVRIRVIEISAFRVVAEVVD